MWIQLFQVELSFVEWLYAQFGSSLAQLLSEAWRELLEVWKKLSGVLNTTEMHFQYTMIIAGKFVGSNFRGTPVFSVFAVCFM